MALFQPSQVVPDVRSGIGLGVVDASQGITVSWHINGPSALVQFGITISTNDAASTILYDSGILTTGCPAYGTTSTGEPKMFSYYIDPVDLEDAGIENGQEYKLEIAQWWANSASARVDQSSASVFLTRNLPSLSISAIGTGGVIGTRSYSFTGNYSQDQGDVLNWFRWQIEDDEGNSLLDTGDISGTMDISCYYDGFFDGGNYRIQLSVQTENGAEVSTGWVSFSASYPTAPTTGMVTAGCVGGTDAVLVEWSGIGYIPGEAGGDYSISEDNVLTLDVDSVVEWNSTGAEALSLAAPWSIVWKGKLGESNADVIMLGQTGGDINIHYDWQTMSLAIMKGSTTLATQSGLINDPMVTLVLTPTNLYIRSDYMYGGLYPSDTLYPATTRYPKADTVPTTDTYNLALSYTQQAITFARIGGWQECDFFEVIQGAASAETIQQAITDGDYTPGLNDSDYMLAQWNDGLNAGNVNLNGDSLVGYSLYRRQGMSTSLIKIADTDISVTRLFDYAALSQQGPYTYYLFPTGENTYIAQPLTSGMVMPCWWNWTLMECAQDGDSGIYTVIAAYRFKLNVETGDMSNNNAPNILQNFTPYPKMQLAPQNYKSGSLTALIGAVDWSSGQPEYVDSTALRDRIFALSVTQNPLFLKTRKGELIRIRVSGAISMQTNDATREQTQTMTLPWVETGSAQGVSLYSATFAGVQEPEGNYVPQFYVDASDATATAKNIRVEKTAYGVGGKIIGEADVSVVGNTLVMPEGMEE